MTKELNQKCAETYYNRGLAHSRNGELDKAIEFQDYTKAIERFKPDHSRSLLQSMVGALVTPRRTGKS